MQQSKDILRISRSDNFKKLRRKDPCYFEGDPVQIISGGFSEIFKNSFDPLDTGHKLSILEIYILFPGGTTVWHNFLGTAKNIQHNIFFGLGWKKWEVNLAIRKVFYCCYIERSMRFLNHILSWDFKSYKW